MNASASRSMTIGTLARASGVGIDAIRFYERQGLLPKPSRRASGYRDYPPAAVQRLRFIRQAKSLGFSLAEIGDLLTLSTDHERGVEGIRRRAEERLAALDHRIAELERVRHGLRSLIEACPGHGTPDHCPILRTLGGDAGDAPPAPFPSATVHR